MQFKLTSLDSKFQANTNVLVMFTFFFFSQLDYAAKTKSTPKAEKSYAETVTKLNDVLAKLG